MKLLARIKTDGLLVAGGIMVTSTFFTGGLNYLYQMYMGRALGLKTYGEFGALYALSFFIFSLLNRTIKVSTASFVSTMKGKENNELIPYFHSKLFLRMLLIGIMALAVFSSLSGYIADFLHLDSTLLVILIGVMMFLSFIIPVNLGMMQGIQKFKSLAFTTIFQSCSKFIIGIGLVILGLGIFGAIGGVILGWFTALIVSFYMIKDITIIPGFRSLGKKNEIESTQKSARDHDWGDKFDLKDVFKFSLPAFIAISCLAVPTNLDVILVKRFFTPEQTGLYTSASVFGKIIYFLPIGISTVMFPKIVELSSRKKDTLVLVIKSMCYTSILGGILAISYILFPSQLLIVYGSNFSDASVLLPYYGILMFFFSLSAVLVYYNLALKRHFFIYIFGLFTVVELVFVSIFHDSLEQVILLFMGFNILLFCVMGLTTFIVRTPSNRG